MADIYANFNKLPDQAKNVFEWFCTNSVLGRREDVLKRILNMNLDYDGCKSPIEVIFKTAFDLLMTLREDAKYLLQPQYEVCVDGKRYILDFAYIDDNLKLAIECDGHEFHEKTLEQVERCHVRDYDLQNNGFVVIHFSGSEIYNDPIECAGKVIRLIRKRISEEG